MLNELEIRQRMAVSYEGQMFGLQRAWGIAKSEGAEKVAQEIEKTLNHTAEMNQRNDELIEKLKESEK